MAKFKKQIGINLEDDEGSFKYYPTTFFKLIMFNAYINSSGELMKMDSNDSYYTYFPECNGGIAWRFSYVEGAHSV